MSTTPRRSFLAALLALPAAVGGLFYTRKARGTTRNFAEVIKRKLAADPELAKGVAEAQLEADAEQVAWEVERDRCQETCRIMRERGLYPIEHGDAPGWWYVCDRTGDWYRHHLEHEKGEPGTPDAFYFGGPSSALLAAEPLYLAWKAEQEAKKA